MRLLGYGPGADRGRKQTWKRSVVMLVALLGMVFPLLGCASAQDDIQGHWVDLNSKTVLDIEGDRIICDFGYEKLKVRYRIVSEGDYREIAPAEGGSFGVMSPLAIREDGLHGNMMILDGPSVSYFFVREGDVEKHTAVQDLSKDLPKEIVSREIVSYELNFSARWHHYDLGPEWEPAHYNWKIHREPETGVYQMWFSQSFDSMLGIQFHAPVSEAYVRGLAELIAEEGISRHNGYFKKNDLKGAGYSLTVKYASGEKLSIMAGGSVGDTCVFRLAPLMAYAMQQPLR